MEISHISAILVFSLCVSVVFSVTTKESIEERLRYGLFTFFSFLLAAIVLGWIMFPFPHR
jgi:hypothetical protein